MKHAILTLSIQNLLTHTPNPLINNARLSNRLQADPPTSTKGDLSIAFGLRWWKRTTFSCTQTCDSVELLSPSCSDNDTTRHDSPPARQSSLTSVRLSFLRLSLPQTWHIHRLNTASEKCLSMPKYALEESPDGGSTTTITFSPQPCSSTELYRQIEILLVTALAGAAYPGLYSHRVLPEHS